MRATKEQLDFRRKLHAKAIAVADSPKPDDIRRVRQAAGLTQAAAAALVSKGARTWEAWEAPRDLRSSRRMPPHVWQSFKKWAGVR